MVKVSDFLHLLVNHKCGLAIWHVVIDKIIEVHHKPETVYPNHGHVFPQIICTVLAVLLLR